MRLTGAVLAEFLELKLEEKRIAARLKEIREAIVEQNYAGNDEFEVKISQHERRELAGLEEIQDKSPKIFEALEKTGLIHVRAQTRVTVKAK